MHVPAGTTRASDMQHAVGDCLRLAEANVYAQVAKEDYRNPVNHNNLPPHLSLGGGKLILKVRGLKGIIVLVLYAWAN